MIPPQLLMLGAQLAMQGINMGIQGANAKKQEGQGREMSTAYKRPMYSAPSSIKENTQNMRMLYQNPNMLGYNLLNKQRLSEQAATLRALKESGAGGGNLHAAMVGLNDNANKADQDMQIAQNDQKTRALQGLGQALTTEAQYADKEFAYNKDQPYQNAQAAAAAQIQASQKQKDNMYQSGTQGVLGMGQQFTQLMQNPEFMKALSDPKIAGMLGGLFKKNSVGGDAMTVDLENGLGVADNTDLTGGAQELTGLGTNVATIPDSESPTDATNLAGGIPLNMLGGTGKGGKMSLQNLLKLAASNKDLLKMITSMQ